MARQPIIAAVRLESTPAGLLERPLRLFEWALLCTLLAGAAVLLRVLQGFEYGLDQGIYAVVADAITADGVPYRDAWDFKPPGVFYVFALARTLFGEDMAGVRWLESLGFASLVPAFGLLSRRFTGRLEPGLLGAALAISGHVWMGFWQTGQPESFGAVLVAWALVFATTQPGQGRRGWPWWAAAGVAYGLAGLLKPPLGGGVLVSAALAARDAGRAADAPRRLRAAALPVAVYAVASLLPVLVVLLHIAAHGGLGDLREALLVFAPGYTALTYHGSNPLVFWFRTAEFLLFRFSLLGVTGLVLLFAMPGRRETETPGVVHVLGVLAFQLAGVALQARFFPYHYGAAAPLVALLAGIGLWKLTRIGRRFGLGTLALLLLLLGNANGPNGPVAGSPWRRWQTWEDGRGYNAPRKEVARWLRRNTPEAASLYVWGFDPVLYDFARRRPASRFIYNAPQRAPWYAERGRPALMEELRSTPPDAIVVQRGDVHPGTAGNRDDSSTALGGFPELRSFLDTGYARATRIGDFTIHLRR